MVKINIGIELPEQVHPEQKHKDLYDKCCDYMQVCESDEESAYHMQYLRRIYDRLKTAKQLPEHLIDLLDKLEEFMLKYDIDRTGLDAGTMFKGKK